MHNTKNLYIIKTVNKSYFFYFILIYSFLFGNLNLFCNTEEINQEYQFISLGSFCWPAQALRAAGFRNIAFPFDWLDTSDHEGFVRILNEDFLHFTDPAYFSKIAHRKLFDGATVLHNYGDTTVLHNYYGAVFSHDWPSKGNYNFKVHLDMIAKKYTRRIDRFRDLKNYKGKVFFIRILSIDTNKIGEPGWNTKKAIEIKEAIKQLFPLLDFTLAIVSCSDPNIPEINEIDGVLEFKIGKLMHMEAYLPMFQTLIHSL